MKINDLKKLSLVLSCFCFLEANAEQGIDQLEIEDELQALEQDLTRYNEILKNTEEKKNSGARSKCVSSTSTWTG